SPRTPSSRPARRSACLAQPLIGSGLMPAPGSVLTWAGTPNRRGRNFFPEFLGHRPGFSRIGRWRGSHRSKMMSSDPNRGKAIFLAAVEGYPPERWAGYLDEACAGEPALRCQVEVLLRAHAGADSLFDASTPDLAATVEASTAR